MKQLPIGTFINVAAVALGSLIGLLLQNTFPANIQAIIFQAVGLSVMLIGIQMGFKIPDGYFLILVFSLIAGGIIGELLDINGQLQSWSEWVKDQFQIQDALFTEGLITAFLVYCVGSMTIVGAIEEGVSGKRSLLLIKSLLDGVGSIAFASTYGIGVLFSIFPMLIFQGGLTLLAKQLQFFFTPTMIAVLGAVGGLLILGIGINLLEIGTIAVENLLPSLVVAALLSWGYGKWFFEKFTSSVPPQN